MDKWSRCCFSGALSGVIFVMFYSFHHVVLPFGEMINKIKPSPWMWTCTVEYQS